MEYTIITIPEMNDSVSRIVINKVQYNIRFTYNDYGDFWTFGLYDSINNPILIGIKIVPSFPLNLFSGTASMPDGVFGVFTELERIGKDDFQDEKAVFIFIPNS